MYPSLTEERVRQIGKVGLVIYANQPLRAAVRAQESLLREIRRAGGIHTIDDRLVPLGRIFDLQDPERSPAPEPRRTPCSPSA
jgi:phosphoenolpyruvate phosphomutase